MLKNILKWTYTVGDRQIDLFIDPDTPLSNVRQLANHLLEYCQQVEDKVKTQKELEKQQQDSRESLNVE